MHRLQGGAVGMQRGCMEGGCRGSRGCSGETYAGEAYTINTHKPEMFLSMVASRLCEDLAIKKVTFGHCSKEGGSLTHA